MDSGEGGPIEGLALFWSLAKKEARAKEVRPKSEANRDNVERARLAARFAGALAVAWSAFAASAFAMNVPASDASKFIGRDAVVCGTVASTHFAQRSRGRPTFLNFEQPYPDQPFAAVVFEDVLARFRLPPDLEYHGKSVCVTGRIRSYKGRAQIVVRAPGQIVEMETGAKAAMPPPAELPAAEAPASYRLLLNSPVSAEPSSRCTAEVCLELVGLLREAKRSIDFAVYGFRSQPTILSELRSAIDRGVRVRGVVDRDLDGGSHYRDTKEVAGIIESVRSDVEVDRATARSQADEGSRSNGFSLRAQQKKYGDWCRQPRGFDGPLSCVEYDLGVSGRLRATQASRKPIEFKGDIMHNKFFVIDDRYVWTGSANISDSGTGGYNANLVLSVDSPELADAFTSEFEQMYAEGKFHQKKVDQGHSNSSVRLYEGASLNVWFPPRGGAVRSLSKLLASAKSKINVAMFFLTHKGLAGELIKAHQRGVSVRLLVDATSAQNEYSKHELLRLVGIPVKVESWGGKMHMKAASIDDEYLIAGSMNWTRAGESKNDENLLVLHAPKAASEFDGFFESMWRSVPDRWLRGRPDPESGDSVGSCSDGMDNDFDDLVDDEDPGCSARRPALPELPPHWVDR